MLTAEQIEKRKKSLGSSDSAAICGLNPWRTPADVFYEKTGRVESFAGNDATAAGDRLESVVVAWAIDRLSPTSSRRAPEQIVNGIMSANLDADAVLADAEPVIIEAKTSGVVRPLDFDAWGEEFAADVPDHFACQVQHQMAVAGPTYQRAFLAALLPPRGFVLFEIHRDEAAIAALKEACERFWAEHVLKDTPPDSWPTIDVARRLKRQHGKQTNVDIELVMAWQSATAAAKEAEERKESAKAALIASLGDADCGIYDGGAVTYFQQTRKAYAVKETTFRTLRLKKGKL